MKTYAFSKKLFVLLLIAVGSLCVNSAYSQVHVNVGVGVPAPVVVYESDFPGYVYYTYPAWHGHYRDRIYYEHYRPIFYREHRAYFRGRAFDHERFERERHWKGDRWNGKEYEHRGPDRGDHDHRH